jgi:hypothetical protein
MKEEKKEMEEYNQNIINSSDTNTNIVTSKNYKLGDTNKDIVTKRNSNVDINDIFIEDNNDLIFFLKNVVLGDTSVTLNNEITTFLSDDDVLDQKIRYHENKLRTYKIIRRNKDLFKLLIILNRRKVVPFTDIKELLNINENTELKRILDTAKDYKLISPCNFFEDNEIEHIKDVLKHKNKRYNKFYRINPKSQEFINKFDKGFEGIYKEQDPDFYKQISNYKLAFKEVEKDLIESRKLFAKKTISQDKKGDMYKFLDFFKKRNVGQKYTIKELIMYFTFVKKLISSKKKVKEGLNYLVDINVLRKVNNQENKVIEFEYLGISEKIERLKD